MWWPRNSFIKYPGIVTVPIGKPIGTVSLSPEEVNMRVESWIETEMRRIDPPVYSAPYTHPGEADAAARAADAVSTRQSIEPPCALFVLLVIPAP